MKILVCVKQVPRFDQVRFQPGINRIVRDGVPSAMNPHDLTALKHALALRAQVGGEVVVMTMGPPGARAVLEQACRQGADRAVHLVDARFAGADTLATARALADLVARERPHLVLLGRSTVDGGTAQVPPQLAVLSGLCQLTHVIALDVQDGRLMAWRETEEGTQRWLLTLPAVVSVEPGPAAAATRLTGAADWAMADRQTVAVSRAAADCLVTELDADALGGDPARYGIRGSATYVQRVVELPGRRRGERTADPAALARWVAELAPRTAGGAGDPGAGDRAPDHAERDLWVVAEPYREILHPVSAEGIAAAARVAVRLRATVTAVLLCADPRRDPAELAAVGADRILVATDPQLTGYAPEPFTTALTQLVAQRSPTAVLGGWTARGRDLLPRVAARLGLGMVGDVIGLDVDPHPGDQSALDLVWLKPAWAGTVLARVVARTVPSFGTMRPGAMAALPRRAGRRPVVERVRTELNCAAEPDPPNAARLIEVDERGGYGLLDACAVLLLAGARLPASDLAHAVQVANSRGWAVAGTAEAVAAGALPASHEVSLRKRTLSPRLVVGLGLAAPEDLAAVRGAAAISTVDPDADAPLHHGADLAAVLPWTDALTALAPRPASPANASGAPPAPQWNPR